MRIFCTNPPTDSRLASMYYAKPEGKTAYRLANDILAHVGPLKPNQRAIWAAHARDTTPEYWQNVFSVLFSMNVALAAIYTDDDFETNPPDGSPLVEYAKHRVAAAYLAQELFCKPYQAVYGVPPHFLRYWDFLERGGCESSVTGNGVTESYSWTNDLKTEVDRLIHNVNRYARTINPFLVVAPLTWCGDVNVTNGIIASKAVQAVRIAEMRHYFSMGATSSVGEVDVVYWNPPNRPDKSDKSMADFLLSIKPTKLSKPLQVIPADAKVIRTGNVVTNLDALRRAA